ncbi:hypothetical protein C7212DRAFT_346134 [Tuber magnatum]|uniref:Uncharacterized protein n=1 Tax=Tuber magnatum TaxID=42249 RepID=A0A317SJ68_9PEZI|nr:hypothetical protein C7212DRAFT_346134 [Tuber magnatum]
MFRQSTKQGVRFIPRQTRPYLRRPFSTDDDDNGLPKLDGDEDDEGSSKHKHDQEWKNWREDRLDLGDFKGEASKRIGEIAMAVGKGFGTLNAEIRTMDGNLGADIERTRGDMRTEIEKTRGNPQAEIRTLNWQVSVLLAGATLDLSLKPIYLTSSFRKKRPQQRIRIVQCSGPGPVILGRGPDVAATHGCTPAVSGSGPTTSGPTGAG